MQLPFFFADRYDPSQQELTLDEDTSRHVVQVLRKKEGDQLHLTDGKGSLLTVSIVDAHKKKCSVKIDEGLYSRPREKKIVIAISLIKNNVRFEWFLEKATEIGITEIVPLICERTEKEKFRSDRMHSIIVSALLQSRQCWLPRLHEPIPYELLFRQEEINGIGIKLIAYCREDVKQPISQLSIHSDSLILIGPEGDFSEKEIEQAVQQDFVPVSLGDTRLRTETAGLVAATLLAAAR